MKNIIVGQSGGPTAVINGSLYGVVTEGLRQTDAIETVFGTVSYTHLTLPTILRV